MTKKKAALPIKKNSIPDVEETFSSTPPS